MKLFLDLTTFLDTSIKLLFVRSWNIVIFISKSEKQTFKNTQNNNVSSKLIINRNIPLIWRNLIWLDINYAFAMSRQCLRILGVWPDPFVSDSKRLNIRFMIVACILSFYVIMPQFTNMILAWGNVARMVEYVASANFSLMALCKLVGTWYHGESKLSFQK